MVSTQVSWQNPTALLEVTGADAAEFLQGQFTNDLGAAASDSPAVYGLWLNVKGKVLADSHVLRTGEESFLVVSNSSPGEVINQRLEDFIIADEVEVADHTGAFGGFLVFGEGASDALTTWELPAPEVGKFAAGETGFVYRARDFGPEAAWQVVFPMEASDFWAGRLAACERIDGSALAAKRAAAGIARIPADVGPGDLPNEAGLDLEAISYTKGCYLGQEVMARLKNLGQVRRRLHIVRTGEAEAAAGLELPASIVDPISKKPIGELRCLHRDEKGAVGLAMLQLLAIEGKGSVGVEGAEDIELKIVGVASGTTR